MNLVCPFCRTAYEIEIEAVSDVREDYRTYECLICSRRFQIPLKRIIAPKSGEDIVLVPTIVKKENTDIFLENLPENMKREVF